MSGTDLAMRPPAHGELAPMALIPLHYAHPGLSLAQILAIVWARREQTLAIVLVILVLSLMTVRLLPRTYEATATLMIKYEVYDPLGGKEFPTGLLGSYIATQIELMRSSSVLMPVIERLHLDQRRTYMAGYKGAPEGLHEWVESLLVKHLQVDQGHYGSQLVYITYSASSAKEAAEVANAVADVYSEQEFSRQNGPAGDREQRYAAQLDELKGKVSKAQEQVTEFRQRTGLLDSDAKIDVDMEKLSTLQQRLIDAQDARRVAEARLTEDGAVSAQVLSSGLVQSLKGELATEQAQMAQLSATLGPRHPQLLALQQQLAATRASLAAEMHTYSHGAVSEVTSARELEQKLQAAVDEQHTKVLETRSLHDQLAKYAVELDSAQSVYKRALDGYDQIMFSSSNHYSNVTSVSRAEPPPKAAKPKTIKTLLLAAIVGLGAGLGGPLSHELMFTRKVRCREDLERDNGMPVLAEFRPRPRLGALT